jgi:hypothetical protein
MLTRIVVMPFGLTLLLLPVCGQQSPFSEPTSGQANDNPNAACVEMLQLPAYPLLARQAGLAGTLTVTVNTGPDGKVQQLSARPNLNNDRAQSVLLIPVQKAIRSSQFRPDCTGKQVILVFEFRINGDPDDHQQQEMAFGFPNRFRITTRPLRFQPVQQYQ